MEVIIKTSHIDWATTCNWRFTNPFPKTKDTDTYWSRLYYGIGSFVSAYKIIKHSFAAIARIVGTITNLIWYIFYKITTEKLDDKDIIAEKNRRFDNFKNYPFFAIRSLGKIIVNAALIIPFTRHPLTRCFCRIFLPQAGDHSAFKP